MRFHSLQDMKEMKLCQKMQWYDGALRRPNRRENAHSSLIGVGGQGLYGDPMLAQRSRRTQRPRTFSFLPIRAYP
jgi:hypothetical protein